MSAHGLCLDCRRDFSECLCQQDEPARRAYAAFCTAVPAVYLPVGAVLPWQELSDVLRQAWRAAAAAARN